MQAVLEVQALQCRGHLTQARPERLASKCPPGHEQELELSTKGAWQEVHAVDEEQARQLVITPQDVQLP